MRIRSIYFKVLDMAAEVAFWREFLSMEPVKQSSHWTEFVIDGTRLGFLLNDFGERLLGCVAVPVFECPLGDVQARATLAQELGATVVLDGLQDPNMNSIVLASPGGNEFELCNCAVHGE